MSAIEIGDRVQTRPGRSAARPLGEVVDIFTAPGGETIAAVKAGPNPHEIQHFDVREIEARKEV